MRNSKLSLLALIATVLYTSPAMAEPIGANAEYVRGVAHVKPFGKSPKLVETGTPLYQGDKIATSPDGIVEIRFDDGNLVRVDHSTEFVIKSLRRDSKSNSTFSIFNLIIGRVKSSVAKLTTVDSRFEYVTKAAIVGVAGTPPWVLEFDGKIAQVDLLGAKGEPGSVYVKAFDPQKTIVHLMSNMRTIVRAGDAPEPPFMIPLQRRRLLDKIIPFSFQEPTKKSEEKKPEAKQASAPVKKEKKQKPPPKTITDNLVTDSLSNSISMPVKPAGGKVNTITGASRMTSTEQGTVGEVGGSKQAPPVAKFQVQVNFGR